MHNYRNRLIVKGHGVFIQPGLIKHVGGRPCAQLLQQIHYWLTADCKIGVSHNNQKWIYNTIETWAQTLGYSVSTIKNCIRHLKQQRLILIEKLSVNKSNRTNFYTINYQQLNLLLSDKIDLKVEDTLTGTQEKKSTKIIGNCLSNRSKIALSSDKNCPMVILETTNKNLIKSYKSENSEEKENKNNFLQEMLQIWNTIVTPAQLTHLNKKRCQFMAAVLKNVFNGDLKKWQNYCQLISSSDFLMGKVKSTFKASLDWALKFDTIQKILEGQYGVQKREHIENHQDLQTIIENEIEATVESDRIKATKKLFLKLYGPQHYKSWLSSHNVLLTCQDESLIISCKTSRFIQDKVTDFFRQQLTNFNLLGLKKVIAC